MLLLRDAGKSFGPRRVLDGATLEVGPRARIGVVGPNGIGKTTLLRLLAGAETPDEGEVRRSPPGLRVAHLPQETDAHPGETLMAYLARRTGVADAESELDRLTRAMERDQDQVDAYSAALDRFLALGGDDLHARAGAVLDDVGLPAGRLDVPVGALSGGQAARAALAALLLVRADVLLLDEPTNNLDFAGLERLERFVATTAAAVVVVSHDREFLDRSVARIAEITEPGHTLRVWAGGWTDFVNRRADARSLQSEAHRRYSGERARLTERMRRQRAWSEQGVRAEKRRPRDNDRAARGARVERSEQQAAKVRATGRAMERLEAVEKPWESWELRMSVSPAAAGSSVVARLEQAVVERGAFRLGPVDLEVRRGDRIAIVGPNGSGKTTLIDALIGRVPLTGGRRHAGPSVVFGEVVQPRDALPPDRPVLESVVERTGLAAQEARSLLAKFALDADVVTRTPGHLSPGERTRAALAELVALQPNCLVLDEPTNHLDLEAIEQLEAALDDYAGTLLLVTHDRRMLQRVRVTRRITVDDSRPGAPVVVEEAGSMA